MIAILILLAAIVVVVAAFPGVRRAGRAEMSWLDASLKAVVVFLGATVLTVLIPSYVLKRQAVAELDRTAQDLIGASLWAVALIAVLWFLRSAQRQGRI